MIDFGEAYVPPRTQFPAPAGASRSERGDTARPTAPSRRDSAAPSRSRLDDRSAAEARRALAARREATLRAQPISRAEILERYRSTAAGRTDSARRDAARRDVADRSALAPGRVDGAQRPSSSRDSGNEGRIVAARRDAAAASRDARISAARKKNARATETRIREARADALDSRVKTARSDYVEALDKRRNNAVRGGPAITATGGPAITAGAHHGTAHVGVHSGGGHGYYDGWYGHYNYHHWNHYGSWCGLGWSSWWWGPSYLCGYWWNCYWYGGGYWHRRYRPHCYWYGPFLPWSVSIVVDSQPEVIYVESDPEVVYLEAPDAEGEAVVDAPVAAAGGGGGSAMNRAAHYYLTEGDTAFLEGRYSDAVHFYAKAVEFSPEDGILYLVLSDALFATGDYRYAAYSLRQAFEKDPGLARNIVDKRAFYSDPTVFDRQLATLERYLEDHFLDQDARLVLAANYVFGGRSRAAQELLEGPFSESLREDPAGALLLETAIQLNQPDVQSLTPGETDTSSEAPFGTTPNEAAPEEATTSAPR